MENNEFDLQDSVFDRSDANVDSLGISSFDKSGNYIDQINVTENHVFTLTNHLNVDPMKAKHDNSQFELKREDTTTGSDTPPLNTKEAIPPEQLRRMSIELVSNKMFREIGDRITKWVF